MKKLFNKVYIEITNKCNFNCPFCSKLVHNMQEISVEQFIEIASQVAKFTNEVCLHVLGEPLIHSKFNEIVSICEQNKLKVNLVTNGYFILEQLPTIIKFSKCFSKINFSLHSYLYNGTNKEQKLADIFKCSKVLASNGINVELRNVATFNDDKFLHLIKILLDRSFGINLVNCFENQKIDNKIYYVVKPQFNWPTNKIDNSELNKKVGTYCLGGITHVAILSNLDVVPCCLDTSSKLKLGNLNEQSFEEILNNGIYKGIVHDFRKGSANNSFCANCNYIKK